MLLYILLDNRQNIIINKNNFISDNLMGLLPSSSNIAFFISWKVFRQETLPTLNADPDSITVSGFSGGSYFATNMHVSNSERIAGVGLFSGGAYGSMDDVFDFVNLRDKTPDVDDYNEYFMKSEENANADSYIKYAQDAESQGKIDSLINLKDKPVFIGSNKRDRVVPTHQ